MERQGVDSAIASYLRMRDRFAGQMTYDLRDYPLRDLGERLTNAKRLPEAIKWLQLASRLFPASPDVAYDLGLAYEASGDKAGAITQYHRLLGMAPDHQRGQRRLRALMAAPS